MSIDATPAVARVDASAEIGSGPSLQFAALPFSAIGDRKEGLKTVIRGCSFFTKTAFES